MWDQGRMKERQEPLAGQSGGSRISFLFECYRSRNNPECTNLDNQRQSGVLFYTMQQICYSAPNHVEYIEANVLYICVD